MKELIPLLVPPVFQSLQDKDDDVRAVAAAALLPITDSLITDLREQVRTVCNDFLGNTISTSV